VIRDFCTASRKGEPFEATGKEHEATLIFLREMAEQWQCPIIWLEYRFFPKTDEPHRFVIRDFCTASRKGEPFEAIIKARNFLPNPVTRFCTSELKIRTGNRYAKALGWTEWDRAVGLRADEPWRVARLKGDTRNENAICPMHAAGHGLAEVTDFWKRQPFDLELPGGDNTFGNCDLCFLKSRAKIEKILQTNPQAGEWWAAQEVAGTWRNDRPTYRQMMTQLTVEGRLFDDAVEDDTLPCQCTD
jgi:3'-phosphoadenosine 5'-phosphosulfate sulfotransferase (PAPS reductase)/FAD synthetase